MLWRRNRLLLHLLWILEEETDPRKKRTAGSVDASVLVVPLHRVKRTALLKPRTFKVDFKEGGRAEAAQASERLGGDGSGAPSSAGSGPASWVQVLPMVQSEARTWTEVLSPEPTSAPWSGKGSSRGSQNVSFSHRLSSLKYSTGFLLDECIILADAGGSARSRWVPRRLVSDVDGSPRGPACYPLGPAQLDARRATLDARAGGFEPRFWFRFRFRPAVCGPREWLPAAERLAAAVHVAGGASGFTRSAAPGSTTSTPEPFYLLSVGANGAASNLEIR